MLSIIDGDIFTSSAKYLCHQCNSITKTGANLAKTVFEHYPWADIYSPRRSQNIDIRDIDDNHPEFPGNVIIRGNGHSERFVINLIGQFYPGKPRFPDSNKDGYNARQNYFKNCLSKVLSIKDLVSIAFPWQIGCGAAGGDWTIYYKMIEKFAEEVKADVGIYRLPSPINNEAIF